MKTFKDVVNETIENIDEAKWHNHSVAVLEQALSDMGFKKSGQVLTMKNLDKGKLAMVKDYVIAIGKLGGPKRKVKYYDETKTTDIV